MADGSFTLCHGTQKPLFGNRYLFRAKGTKCDSPGQRPGIMQNNRPKPQRGERFCITITPFQGFSISLRYTWGVALGYHIVPLWGTTQNADYMTLQSQTYRSSNSIP